MIKRLQQFMEASPYWIPFALSIMVVIGTIEGPFQIKVNLFIMATWAIVVYSLIRLMNRPPEVVICRCRPGDLLPR